MRAAATRADLVTGDADADRRDRRDAAGDHRHERAFRRNVDHGHHGHVRASTPSRGGLLPFECRVYPAALTPPAFSACSPADTHTASRILARRTYSFEVRATGTRAAATRTRRRPSGPSPSTAGRSHGDDPRTGTGTPATSTGTGHGDRHREPRRRPHGRPRRRTHRDGSTTTRRWCRSRPARSLERCSSTRARATRCTAARRATGLPKGAKVPGRPARAGGAAFKAPAAMRRRRRGPQRAARSSRALRAGASGATLRADDHARPVRATSKRRRRGRSARGKAPRPEPRTAVRADGRQARAAAPDPGGDGGRRLSSPPRDEALPPGEPARGRPAAAAHGRADAARRPGGELLVPPPPRGLRVDRRARARAARGRPRVRGGLRLGRARAHAPRSVVGVDANPEAFEHARLKYTRANVALRAHDDRAVGRRRRLRRVPADDRAHHGIRPQCSRTCARSCARAAWRSSPPRTCSRWRRRARSGPTTRGTCAGTARRTFARCVFRHVRGGRAVRGVPCSRAACSRGGAGSLGWGTVIGTAATHAAVLRPLRARDLQPGLRRAARAAGPVTGPGGRAPLPASVGRSSSPGERRSGTGTKGTTRLLGPCAAPAPTVLPGRWEGTCGRRSCPERRPRGTPSIRLPSILVDSHRAESPSNDGGERGNQEEPGRLRGRIAAATGVAQVSARARQLTP